MFSLDLDHITKRSEAEAGLLPFIPEFGVRQFILKNLDRKQDQKFEWKLNLHAIYKNYASINESLFPITEFLNLSASYSVPNHPMYPKKIAKKLRYIFPNQNL